MIEAVGLAAGTSYSSMEFRSSRSVLGCFDSAI